MNNFPFYCTVLIRFSKRIFNVLLLRFLGLIINDITCEGHGVYKFVIFRSA